jgi:transmembrane sensor
MDRKVELPGTRDTSVQVAQPKVNQAAEHQRYATLNGSRRTARLADGSSVELDEDSELFTNFSLIGRELKLNAVVPALRLHTRAALRRPGRWRKRHGPRDGLRVSLESDKRVTVRLLRGAVDVERPATIRGTTPRRPSRVSNRARPSVSRPSRRPCFDPRREGLSFSLRSAAGHLAVREYERTP